MGEAAFQLINAALFAISAAITPAKHPESGIVAQSGVPAEQQETTAPSATADRTVVSHEGAASSDATPK